MNILRVAFLGLATITTLLALLFMVRYHLKVKGDWWYSEMGRHLMAFSAAIGLVCGVWSAAIVLSLLGAELPMWFHITRVAVFATIPAVLAWRLSMLERAHPHQLVAIEQEGDEDARA